MKWKKRCGVVWCSVAWCGVAWCGVVWRGVVRCGVAWCGVAWLECSLTIVQRGWNVLRVFFRCGDWCGVMSVVMWCGQSLVKCNGGLVTLWCGETVVWSEFSEV
nr:hypothetical protein BgiMline_030330 [Biomphalaria glabrata]